MAKFHGKYKELGVEIPSDLQPENWQLYVLCAPSGEEWYRAVHSAVRLLARGRFWGRDDRTNSIKSAQLVGAQIERSLMTCNIDFTDLGDAIRYLADTLVVNQSNTQTVSCGGGGSGGGGVLDEPLNQDETIPVDIIPPIPIADETGMTAQEKCSVAAYLADSWVDTFTTINNSWGTIAVGITTVTTWLQEKFPGGQVLPFVAMIVTSLAVALEAALLAGLANNMSDAAQSQRDDLECAVASATSAIEAKQNFESVLANVREQYGKVTYTVMILVAQMLDWNKIMGDEVIVPASYDNAVCCGQQSLGGGWMLAPLSLIEGIAGSSSGTTQHELTQSGSEFTASIVADTAGRTGNIHGRFEIPTAVGQNWLIYGFASFPTNKFNVGNWAFYSAGAIPGDLTLWSGSLLTQATTDPIYVVHTTYASQFNSDTGLTAATAISTPDGDPLIGQPVSIGLTGYYSLASGEFWTARQLYAIVKPSA